MKRQLISWVFYQEKKFIWYYDEILCALCKINIQTLQVECVASPMLLLVDGGYEVGKLIGWKNKIILLPMDINRKWVVYDKQSGKVEYWSVCAEPHKYAEAIRRNNLLTIFPISARDSILVVDLYKKKVVEKIELTAFGFTAENGMEIWSVEEISQDMCFLVQNSFYYGRIGDGKLHLIRIDAGEPLQCADFYEDTGWAISSHGDYLYHFDKKGNVLEKYLAEPGTDFIRIVISHNKIFLLPVNESEVRAFDIHNKKIKKIEWFQENGVSGFPEIINMPGYWGYIKFTACIWLLPLKYPLQIIDFETLACKQKVIEYTDEFSEKTYMQYTDYVRKMRTFTFVENLSSRSLEKYLELTKQYELMSKWSNKYYGKNIWEQCTKSRKRN